MSATDQKRLLLPPAQRLATRSNAANFLPERLTDEQKQIIADVLAGPRGVSWRGTHGTPMMRSPGLMEQAQKIWRSTCASRSATGLKRLHEDDCDSGRPSLDQPVRMGRHIILRRSKLAFRPSIAEAIARRRVALTKWPTTKDTLYNFCERNLQ